MNIKKIIPSSKIEMGKSQIPQAGRGVFATQPIKKNEVIEECPILVVPRKRQKDGEKSLRCREIVTGESNVPYLSDEATALVGVTVINKPVDHLFVDEESDLRVRFVREAGMYLFKGEIEE